jgi:hypothetical protein
MIGTFVGINDSTIIDTNFTNGSFEADRSVTTYTQMTPSGWVGSGNTYVILSPNATWGVSSAPNGSYVCALQNTATVNTYISQYFRCFIGNPYTISFYVCERSNDSPLTNHNIQVLIDGVVELTQNSLTTTWTNYSFIFTPTKTTHNLQFTNTSTLGTNYSVLLDNIVITRNNSVVNGNFEADLVGVSTYMTPTGWTAPQPSPIVIVSGDVNWGGRTAQSGSYFLGLQNYGYSVYQTISGSIGNSYRISFWATQRLGDQPGQFAITINGAGIYASPVMTPGGGWSNFILTYTATSTSFQLGFLNASSPGDKTIFFDNILVTQYSILLNADFEADTDVSAATYGSPYGWTGVNSLIIKIPNTSWTIYSNINNSYICGIQNTAGITSSITQTVTMVIGIHYLISFYTSIRSTDSGSHDIQVLINSVTKFTKNTLSTTWTNYSFIFVATNTSHVIMFKNTSVTSGDITIFLDKIVIKSIY